MADIEKDTYFSYNPAAGTIETEQSPHARTLRHAGLAGLLIMFIDAFRFFVGHTGYVDRSGFVKLKEWFSIQNSPIRPGTLDYSMLGIPRFLLMKTRPLVDVVWHGKMPQWQGFEVGDRKNAESWERFLYFFPLLIVGGLSLLFNAPKYALGVLLTIVSAPVIIAVNIGAYIATRDDRPILQGANFTRADGATGNFYAEFARKSNKRLQTAEINEDELEFKDNEGVPKTTYKVTAAENRAVVDALLRRNVSNCLTELENQESELAQGWYNQLSNKFRTPAILIG